MKNKPISQLVAPAILLTAAYSSVVTSAVLYEDQFDQVEATGIYAKDFTGTENYLLSKTSNYTVNKATIENGVLSVFTASTPHGGVVTKLMPELDFFKNEITITFRGIGLQPANTIDENGVEEPGSFSAQGIVMGLGSKYLGFGSYNGWTTGSRFHAFLQGSGYFDFNTYTNSLTKYLYPNAIQEVPTPYLNFGINDLTAIKLTLDDTNYRLLYEFGNPLNALSFAGPHYLEKDLWNVSTAMRQFAVAKNNAEADLDAAVASGDTNLIADAQTALDAVMVDYTPLFNAEEPEMEIGRTHV